MKHSQLKQLIKEEIQSILSEWGGGIPDPRDAERYAKERAWDERQKLPVASRGQLEAGDVVEYDGKKWMIMYIYDDGDVDLKMQQPFRDEMGITKIGDPRAYAEKVSRSEIK